VITLHPQSAIQNWLKDEHALSKLQVGRISFDASKEWQWNHNGFLTHITSRFFNVVGVRYFSVDRGKILTQPIIDQSEIGLLAFLVFKDTEDWWILAHAKVEPGNVNGAQLAPTVQATKSNYEIAHGGSETPYLGRVQSARRRLYDQLQSEQNSRFLAKRNRNRVTQLTEKIEEKGSHFRWIPIRDFLSQLRKSHTVNTDARSVIACWLLTDLNAMRECLPRNAFSELLMGSMVSPHTLHPTQSLDEWLGSLKQTWRRKPEIISLKALDLPWTCTEEEICSPDDPSLMIYQIAVSCEKREVTQWDQPIAGTRTQSKMILFIGTLNGTLHLLLQAKLEAGNRNGFELTTTVQSDSSHVPDFEKVYIEMAQTGKPLLNFDNSEEGGRFDQCISHYQVIWMDDVVREQEDSFHRWVSLSQVSDFLRRENVITNELRSILSSLLCCPDL
jgi:oxidase EvaA